MGIFEQEERIPLLDEYHKPYCGPESSGDDKTREKDEKTPKNKPRSVSVLQLFRYSDRWDVFLLTCGCLAAFLHGAGMPILAVVFGQMTNTFVAQAKQGFAPSIINATFLNITESKNATDSLTAEEFADYMTRYSLYYVYIGLGVFVASFFQALCWEVSCERQVYRLRQEFFYQVLRQEISWFDARQTGDLVTKLQDDLERVRDGVGHKCSMIIQYVSTFVSGFIVGFFVSWQLTLVILSLTPVLAATSAYVGKVLATSSAREQEKYGLAGAVAEEVVSCIRTVASFCGQQKEIQRYDDALEKGRLLAKKKYTAFAWGTAIVFFVMYSSYGLAFWYGCQLLNQQLLNPGHIFTVFFSVLIGAFSLGNAIPYVSIVSVAQGSAGVLFEIISTMPKIDPYSTKGEILEKVEGRIVFRDVSFTYSTRKDVEVLKEFSLYLEPGQTVALVGASGSGKSTVVNLLLRFYDPTSGQIFVDDKDVCGLNLASLRHHIGVVSQEPVLFSGSIAENIRYGREDVTWDALILAAKKANAHKFITLLPQSYDTLVGERGAQLSGGQKQRIAIARALVRDPKILLLDEATSALDAQSEGVVQAALNKAREGRTTIIIAHRLSTIKDADTIYVMQHGEIMEKGKHMDLMDREGLYYELVTAQTTNGNTPGFLSDSSYATSGTGASTDDDQRSATGSPRRRKKHFQPGCSVPDRERERIELEAEKEQIVEPSVWKIMQVNRAEWPLLSVGVLGSIVLGASMPAFAYFYSQMFETFTKSGQELLDAAFFWSMMFLVLAVATGLGRWANLVGIAIPGESLTKRMRLLSFQNVLRQSIGWFDHDCNASGRITTRLARDAPIVKQAAGHRMGMLIIAGVTVIASIIIAFVYNWELALVILIGFPILVTAGFIQMRLQRGGQRKDAELMEEAGRIATESLQNIRTVQALTRERLFFEKYFDSLMPAFAEARKQAYVYAAIFGFSEAVVFLMYAAAFRFGAYQVQYEGEDPTNVYRVFFVITFAAASVGQTLAFLPDFTKAKLASGLMFHLIELEPDIDSYSKVGSRPEIKGKLTFKDVNFHYPTRPDVKVLDGFSLTVEEGRSLAVVGPSGSGKSTLIALLQRFYDPTSGYVAIDGQDIRDINITCLRNQIGLVTQEPVLFDCSIKDNIAYGVNDRDVNMHEVIAAARKANIHSFIMGLPAGYETVVGERGTQLSGGQKQRIAIARALIRNPKILLLDEATSALDTESEKYVQEALDKATEGRTCIIVAHRLSTVQNADCIVVVDKGRIVESGTHDELRLKHGVYYRLTKRQQIRH